MKERAVAMEKTRSLENLHELRLMALLLDVIREKGRMEAADLLGVNYKTLARAVETGSLSPRMSHALDRLLLSRESKAMAAQQERIAALEGRVEGLEQKIKSSLGKVRAFVEGQVKALGEEHTRALRQLERRVAEVGAGQGSGSGANAVRKPVGNTTFRRKYPELVTREPAPDDEEVYGAAWPLVEEWRRLREGHPNDGRSLSWLVTEERILNLELAMAEEHGLTLPPETQPLAGGVEERAATLDRSGPGRHPVGADQEGAAQVGAAVLHRGTVVEVGAASSPHHVCCMSASDVGGKARKYCQRGDGA